MSRVKAEADLRQEAVEAALKEAFSGFIERREVEVISFAGMSALDLAKAIAAQPLVLKPLLACCNIAGRAIERDLEIKNLDTYSPRISQDHAQVIAGYIKPFLPPYLELPALSQIDRVAYIDKEIRKGKGRWERLVLEALNRFGAATFRKRKFKVGGEEFELDAATPEQGDVEIGIDVKRIEARRDIHKRCDEIINKGAKLREAFPKARFGAVVYYPFIDEHVNVQSRLRSPHVGGIVFASEATDSVENAVKLLLSMLKAGA
jgi:hypothetical protein